MDLIVLVYAVLLSDQVLLFWVKYLSCIGASIKYNKLVFRYSKLQC